MIKTDRKRPCEDPGAALQAQETPFYFNELIEIVNEKIRTSNTSKREQLCAKPREHSMGLLLPHGMFP
jgi:hypothetical protein